MMFRVLVVCSLVLLTASVQADDVGKKQADKKKFVRDYASIAIDTDNEYVISAITDNSDVKGKATKYHYTNDINTVIKKFCERIHGRNTVDAIAIDREMTQAELASCNLYGVKDLIKINLGEEVIVFATDKSAKATPLTRRTIWQAFAADTFIDPNDASSRVIPNPYKKWSDMDKSLPDAKIKLIVPDNNTPLFQSLKYAGLQQGCRMHDQIADMKFHRHYRSWYRSYCYKVRDDGVLITLTEKENIANSIAANKGAVGVMLFNDWLTAVDRLQALPVEGVLPTSETIKDGSYLLRRPHIFYVKKAMISKVSGLKKLVDEMTSEAAIGKDGYLTKLGLLQIIASEKTTVEVDASKAGK